MSTSMRARKRPQMTKQMWGALSAFDWATRARDMWSLLSRDTQQLVFDAAKAEEEANRRYVLAANAIEWIVGRGGKR